MTEEAKRAAIEKVKAMLDENERIRVIETRSIEARPSGQGEREIRNGRQTYMLIAVGDETESEKMALRLLSSALMSR